MRSLRSQDGSRRIAVGGAFQLPCGSVAGRAVNLTRLQWSVERGFAVRCTPFALDLSLLPAQSPGERVQRGSVPLPS